MLAFTACLMAMIVYPISRAFKSMRSRRLLSDGIDIDGFVVAFVFGLIHLFTPYFNNFYYGLAIVVVLIHADINLNKLSLLCVSLQAKPQSGHEVRIKREQLLLC